METTNGGYSRLAAEYNWHLRNGELGKCGKDQFLMAAALRAEGRRTDELKALMLVFFFDLNGVDSGPAINRSTSKRAAEAFAASGLGRHEMEELYTDTIRQDTVPRPVMSVKDSLYVFEVCLEERFEEADEILARFMNSLPVGREAGRSGGHTCSDCEHFEHEESWDDTVAWCEKGHDDHVGWNTEPCEDFKESV